MGPAVQVDIRAKQRPCANGNQTGVENDTVEVDKSPIANFEIGAVVGSEGTFNPRVILEEFIVFFTVGGLRWKRAFVV